MFRKTVCLLLAVLMALCVIGCSNNNVAVIYDKNSPVNTEDAGTVTSNSNYELLWDDDTANVILKSLINGKVWSTIPYGYEGSSSAVKSTINLTVMDTSSMKQDTVRGQAAAVSSGRVASEKIKNGIKVTYYFDNYMISVPVEYVLRDDSLEVSIKTAEIVEGGNYVAVSIELSPYLCSADNSDLGAYLFVPTGSGAIMNVGTNADATRKYTGTVYGEDASRILPEIPIDNEQIYMPVFGTAISDGNAILGIIENADETALISAEAGNARTSWSCVYPTFYLRGYDSFPTTQWIWSYQDLNYLSEDVIDTTITVGYYPLYDEDANYNGMAKRYRKYLTDTKQLEKSSISAKPYALSIIGGALKTVATGGIPHEVTSVLTTFEDAQKIITDITKSSGTTPSVQMLGYGNNGLDVGKIAGGYKFSSNFGGEKARKTLEKTCAENEIDIFVDFDLIRYNQSGNGFNKTFDAAKSATLRVAESYLINNPLRDFDKDTVYRFLRKSKIDEATQKLIKMADKKQVSGISLASLSNVAYSDYTESQYGVKGEMTEITQKTISDIKNAKHSVAASAANIYAAASADVVYNTSVTNGGYDVFDMWIPFYQMVLSGSKPMYSSYINLEEDVNTATLRAIASGSGLGFALINQYDIDLSVSNTFSLYGTVYEDNKERIVNALKTYGEYYKLINGASINSFIMIADNVSLTEFDNGVSVYVNYSENTVATPIGEIAPLSAQWIKN